MAPSVSDGSTRMAVGSVGLAALLLLASYRGSNVASEAFAPATVQARPATAALVGQGLNTVAGVEELFQYANGGVPSESDGSGTILRSAADLGLHKVAKSRDQQQDKLRQGEITSQQVALERAGFLLDAVALGATANGGDWADPAFRSELAELCEAAGLPEAARLVRIGPH
eukprot:TRINITY_DN14366_c0_g1_i1.p2 TRINITY_DN14366_c0_g1~~TRINITY_DN14366_c0_g1_i1.p2  ORF type:complete len:171 (-),score=12.04 TRINITY_DN14366_c0_g1_i1:86-598(-)